MQLCDIIGQVKDFLQLDDVAMKSKSVLIVGGGFLGSELAVGLASRGERFMINFMNYLNIS